MKVHTKSGSTYHIDERGICRKYNAQGELIDSFKAMTIKSVPSDRTSWQEVLALPDSKPKVGESMYISGLNSWWLSTKVIEVEDSEVILDTPDANHPPAAFRDASNGE